MRQFYALHRRTMLALTAAGAVLVVLVTSVLVLTTRRGDRITPGQPATAGQPTATGSPSITEPEPAVGIGSSSPTGPGSWRPLPAAPVPASYTNAGAWTGADLLVLTPYTQPGEQNVLAAYRPAGNAWRMLASSPYAAVLKEGGQRVVWTRRELLAFGLLDAAYNPATNHWRRIAAGAPAGASATVWTGMQVLMWGGGCCGDFRADGAAYDPAANVWTPIATAPLAARTAPGVWTGKEVVVVGGNTYEKAFAGGAAYNPATKHWRTLPALPEPRTWASLTWTGTEVLVVGGMNLAVPGPACTPTATRTTRPRTAGGTCPPAASREPTTWRYGPVHGCWSGAAATRWSTMPASPLQGRTAPVAVWTGTEMLVFGGLQLRPYQTFKDAAAYRP